MAQQFADVRFDGVGAFSPSGAGIAYLRPDADDTDGGWTNELDGSVLFSSIDEAAPADDNDYIKSSTGPFPDVCKVRLSNPSSLVATPAKVRIRYKKSGTDEINLVVQLKQGATEIAQWSYVNIPNTFTTAEEVLTTAQFNAITDFNDLFLEFQAGAEVYSGPGDIVSGAARWWGLRAYSSATIGNNAVRLRRDSDNSEQDFVTLSDGSLDVASIASFKGAANLFVVTLYDQAGSNNFVQSTAASQPKFTLSGLGSLPIMDFSTSREMISASTETYSQPQTMSVVLQGTGVGGTASIYGGGGNVMGMISSGQAFMWSGSFQTASMSNDAWHSFNAVYNGASSDANIDGVANAIDPGPNNVSSATVTLGVNTPGTQPWGRECVEIGRWPFDFSSGQSSAMSTNQHDYWGF